MKQKVDYDWKPTFCNKCLIVGHRCIVKPTAPQQPAPKKQEWRTKMPTQLYQDIVVEQVPSRDRKEPE
ncbi:hypothetical protein HAX54_035200, partial [Datura stramonium]|nr:hypothetical protein [Datura stramonium]